MSSFLKNIKNKNTSPRKNRVKYKMQILHGSTRVAYRNKRYAALLTLTQLYGTAYPNKFNRLRRHSAVVGIAAMFICLSALTGRLSENSFCSTHSASTFLMSPLKTHCINPAYTFFAISFWNARQYTKYYLCFLNFSDKKIATQSLYPEFSKATI